MSLNKIFFLATFFFFQNLVAQNSVEIDISKTTSDISSTMYGVFFEDINFSADGGLYAELIKNRSFEFTLPKMGWFEPNSDRHSYNEDSGISTVMRYKGYNSNKRYLNVKVNNSENYELINEGFRGIGVKKDITYNFSILAANTKGINKITLELYADENIIGTSTIDLIEGSWRIYETVIKVNETNPKAKLKLKFEGEGSLDIDMISLFPSDTWKGRKNGLRKDLVELIEDLNPGFIRFPGGCIVEGRTLDRRYQWKKTIGPIENRELIVNRWNTEFSHRNTPDYYQSFGLGFFEYFLLSEDLNAEPLPILGCGMACQFNTGELVPMDDMGPYIQDALDLIEFANGGITTHWGKLRAEMGHPEPFNMKYIGIGNEQWGPEYIKRYKIFDKAIKEKYPDIIIISGSGPFPEGDFFEYGWEELKKLNVEIVDEHFYKSPDWFKKMQIDMTHMIGMVQKFSLVNMPLNRIKLLVLKIKIIGNVLYQKQHL
jgi:alpha-N-arabinofuranosidase